MATEECSTQSGGLPWISRTRRSGGLSSLDPNLGGCEWLDLKQFLCQYAILFRCRVSRPVYYARQTFAWRLGHSDGSWDYGFQNSLAKVFVDLLHDSA